MRILRLVLCGAAIAATVVAQSQQRSDETRQKLRDARTFRRLQLPGEDVAAGVRRLTEELRWHKSLSGALQAGRSRGRPVVWIQALGDLDGFL